MAGAFVAMFTAFGIAYSFGAFFEAMAADFDAGRGATAAVFSLTSLTYFLLGALSGGAVHRFGPRRVLAVGAVALGAGLVATSRAGELWIGYLTYGFGVGVAVACAYVPMVAVVGGWFDRRRTVALGVAVSGIGLGTLVLAPIAARLIDAIGWREAYLALGLGGAAVLLCCAIVVAPPPEEEVEPGVSLREAVRDADYRWLYLSGVLASLVLFVPFVHLPSYAEGRGVDPVAAAGLVGVIGAASVVGRLVLGALADRLGLDRTYRMCFLTMGASFLLWWLADGYPALVAFAVVLGTGYGGFIALNPAVVAARFGTERLGALVGVLYTSAGFGSAVGAPLAGVLIDATGSYVPAIAGSLALGLASYAALLPFGRTAPSTAR